jgi:predicted transporter
MRGLRFAFRFAIFVAAACVVILVIGAIADPSAVTWTDVRTVIGVLLLLGAFRLWSVRLASLRKRTFASRAEARRMYTLSVALPQAVLMTASGFLLFGWVGALGFFALAAFGITAAQRKLFQPPTQLTAPR